MKTFEEINEALDKIVKDAYQSGFSVSAAIVSYTTENSEWNMSTHTCGNPFTCLALTDIIKDKILREIAHS